MKFIVAKVASKRDNCSYQVFVMTRELVYDPYESTMYLLQDAIKRAKSLNDEYEYHSGRPSRRRS